MQVRTQDETNKGERPEIPSSCPVSRSLNTMSDITHNLDAENKQYGNIRDPILRNVAIKVGSGLAVGVALSLTIFKRRLTPIAFAVGVGSGMAYSDAIHLFRATYRRQFQDETKESSKTP